MYKIYKMVEETMADHKCYKNYTNSVNIDKNFDDIYSGKYDNILFKKSESTGGKRKSRKTRKSRNSKKSRKNSRKNSRRNRK